VRFGNIVGFRRRVHLDQRARKALAEPQAIGPQTGIGASSGQRVVNPHEPDAGSDPARIGVAQQSAVAPATHSCQENDDSGAPRLATTLRQGDVSADRSYFASQVSGEQLFDGLNGQSVALLVEDPAGRCAFPGGHPDPDLGHLLHGTDLLQLLEQLRQLARPQTELSGRPPAHLTPPAPHLTSTVVECVDPALCIT